MYLVALNLPKQFALRHTCHEILVHRVLKHNVDTEQTARLSQSIIRCSNDIREAEGKLKRVDLARAPRELRGVWTRIKWSTSTRSWLQRLLRRVETWHVILLSYELAMIHM